MKSAPLILVLMVGAVGLVAGATVGADDTPPSPLASYIGFGHDPNLERTIYESQELDRQRSIKACMASRGLMYEALEPDFNVLAPSDEPLEYFGLVAPYSPISPPDPSEPRLRQDPNVLFAESLDDRQRNEFYEALYGFDWQNPAQSAEKFRESCTGAAYAGTPGLGAEVASLRGEYREAQRAALAADAQVLAATKDWRECMANRGLDVASWEDMLGQIEASVDDQITSDGVLTPESYDELLAYEARVFEADRSCRPDLRAAMQRFVVGFEESFVQSHLDELQPFQVSKW